jgi:hypothetical protein
MKANIITTTCLLFGLCVLLVEACCKPDKVPAKLCGVNQTLYPGDSCGCNYTSIKLGDSCINTGTIVNDSSLANNRYYVNAINGCGDFRDSLQLQCAKNYPIKSGLFLTFYRGTKRWEALGLRYMDSLYDIGFADSFNAGFAYFHDEKASTFDTDIDCDITGWQSKDKDSIKLYIVPRLTHDTCASYLISLN